MEEFHFSKTLKEAIVTKLVDLAIDSFNNTFKKLYGSKKNSKEKTDFENKIFNHFNEVYNWSKEIEFIGLAKPLEIRNKTIDLKYYFSRLRYSVEDKTVQYTEDDILLSNTHIIVEGQPGSGKTTTLKRILINSFFNANQLNLIFNYPILIRFRAIDANFDLYTYICFLLGIKYETFIKEEEVMIRKVRAVGGLSKIDKDEVYYEKEIKKVIFHVINDTP